MRIQVNQQETVTLKMANQVTYNRVERNEVLIANINFFLMVLTRDRLAILESASPNKITSLKTVKEKYSKWRYEY